jgi:DNA-binding CsgD family transcriptional regulator
MMYDFLKSILNSDMIPDEQNENQQKPVTGAMMLLPISTVPAEKLRVVRGSMLTHREMQTLLCISEGFTSEEIAEHLGLRRGTIDTYRKNIMHKLRVKNLAQAITYSFRNKIIQ